jgi:hypothetical protein
MAHVLIQHKIAKWSEFESIFRADGPRRKKLGSKGAKVYRNVQDPENVFMVIEWDNVENAQKFANGLETHQAILWATSGVWSRIYVVDEAFETEA